MKSKDTKKADAQDDLSNGAASHLRISEKCLNAETIIPKTVIIETVFGCNASCTMCPIDMPTDRVKGIIDPDLFVRIIDELASYRSEIEQLDLFGVGEPLLDPDYAKKIAYTKSKGFSDVGFATNAELLTGAKAVEVLEAGIDTIMISIDGVKGETHESIRRNTTFENVVNNTLNAIALRNNYNHSTKFVLRFIRQEANIDEWADFCAFWKENIDASRGDLIIGYDLHSWGGEIVTPDTGKGVIVEDDLPCHHLFDRMIILRDGAVVLCCADMHHGNIAVGNCVEDTPIDAFNSRKMQKFRELHIEGNRLHMEICQKCTILESEAYKDKLEHKVV